MTLYSSTNSDKLSDPEDGRLDVVVVRYGSVVELIGVAARLLAGNYLPSARVFHRQVRRVRIASRPGMWFNIDGELLTNEPVTISVLPQALRVVVGPTYAPKPTV
jgi:diacylglycerol kinase (ATP)